MAGQSVTFDFLSHGASELAGDFRKTADSSVLAAKGARLLSDALEKQRKASDVSAGATLALAKADKILADAEHTLADGALEAELALKREAAAADKAGRSNEAAAGGLSALAGSGGIPGGGMGAAIAAGVALSPILVTVGTGLGGVGLAAAGIIRPIENAAKKTGGLSANMHLLNAEQQTVARGILGLGTQFHHFEAALQPAVLGDFNAGLRIAGHLLHDIQPVSIATGKALGGVLGQLDATFQDQQWQQFFGFMSRTAGPDIRQLGTLFVDLTNALPPLLEALQPVGSAILKVGDDAAKALGPLGQLFLLIDHNNHNIQQGARNLDSWSASLMNKIPGLKQVSGWITSVQHSVTGQGRALKVTTPLQAAAAKAATAQTAALTALNAAMTANIAKVLTLEGDQVSWKQAQQAATTAINANHKALDGNSASALTARAAIIAATGATIKFADDSNTSTGALHRASGAIQDQIGWLEKHAAHSKIATDEIHALRMEEAKIQRQIQQRITMTGSGRYSISSFGPNPVNNPIGKLAAGWRVPGYGGGDRFPALLEGGEAVVPKHLTPAVAPFLRAQGVPGFAAGGLAGSYSGNIPGLTGFAASMEKAFTAAMTASMVGAMHSAIRAAASMFAGPTGGSTGPGAAAAQSWMRAHLGDYGWGMNQWASLVALWNGESGWRWNAQNPNSPAYGIPQADPGSKMAAAGADWRTNPVTQMRWGAEYIRETPGYGTPAAAYSKWLARNPHWYDHGGYLPQGLSLAYNGTGKPEPVGAAAGTTVNITLNVQTAVGQNPAEVGRQIAEYLLKHTKNGGRLYPLGITPK